MRDISIHESEERQKEIIRKFISEVKSRKFLNQSDFDDVFLFFRKISGLECESFGISSESFVKNNNLDTLSQSVVNRLTEDDWKGIETASCDISNSHGRDIDFFVDPVFFCKKYFEKDDVKDRISGVIELLLTTYHEVDHAVKFTNLSRGYLSPETIEISEEMLLRDFSDKEFYDRNYSSLFMERYADKFAFSTLIDMVDDSETLEIAREIIEDKIAVSKISKLDYMGRMYKRSDLLPRQCDRIIKDYHNLIYMYPALQKKYKASGEKKGLCELFDGMSEDLKHIVHRYVSLDTNHELNPGMMKESFDCQTFYYELILPELSYATPQEYKLLCEKYGASALQNICANMEKYFNAKAQDKLQYADKYKGDKYESEQEIKAENERNVNAIVRFRNGVEYNRIADTLLREGGFIRGTREVLPKDILKRRKMFAESLIGVYDAIESEDEYKNRVKNEESDISEVISSLYYNRFENFMKNVVINEQGEAELGRNEIVRMAQILKISKIVSTTLGENFFDEFLQVPDVNRMLIAFEKSKNTYLGESMKQSPIRFKKVKYPDTKAELGEFKEYIEGGQEIKSMVEMLKEEIGHKDCTLQENLTH